MKPAGLVQTALIQRIIDQLSRRLVREDAQPTWIASYDWRGAAIPGGPDSSAEMARRQLAPWG